MAIYNHSPAELNERIKINKHDLKKTYEEILKDCHVSKVDHVDFTISPTDLQTPKIKTPEVTTLPPVDVQLVWRRLFNIDREVSQLPVYNNEANNFPDELTIDDYRRNSPHNSLDENPIWSIGNTGPVTYNHLNDSEIRPRLSYIYNRTYTTPRVGHPYFTNHENDSLAAVFDEDNLNKIFVAQGENREYTLNSYPE